MGFLPSIRKIVAQVPRDRQTLLLSATLDDSAIAGITDLVHDPARVEIAHKGMLPSPLERASSSSLTRLMLRTLTREFS